MSQPVSQIQGQRQTQSQGVPFGSGSGSAHKAKATEVINSHSGRLPAQLMREAGQVLGQSFVADPSMHYATGFVPVSEVASSKAPPSASAKQMRHARLVERICSDMVGYAAGAKSCYLDLALVPVSSASGVEVEFAVAGVAMWVMPGAHISTPGMIKSGCWQWPFVMSPAVIGRSLFYSAVVEEHHLRRMPAPHWYLYMVGVDPRLQCQGIGTKLLRHGLDRADRTGCPAWLESFNSRNLSLYHRQGFSVLDTACTPNENGPRFWMLARQPARYGYETEARSTQTEPTVRKRSESK